MMYGVDEAIANAKIFASQIFNRPIKDFKVEELDSLQSEENYMVTLGFNYCKGITRWSSKEGNLPAQDSHATYKVFTVSRKTGEVLKMSMR